MMKKIILIIISLSTTMLASAQDKLVIDSLRKQLYKEMPDTSRVQLMLEGFALQYYLSDPQRAIDYCLQALELSEKIKYESGIGSSLGWLAFLYEQQGQITKAIEYNQKSLALFRKIGNRQQEGTVLNNLAAIHKDRGNIPEAIKYNNESLKIKIALNDSEGIATTYNNFGLLYSNQGNIALSLDYYFKALKIEESLKNVDGISTAWHNIGTIYKEQGELTDARKALDKAYEVRKLAKDKYGMAYSLNAYGGLYEIQDSLDLALDYYNRALQLRTEIEDKQGMAYSLKNIGGIYEKKKLSGATGHYFKSFELFREMDDKWGMTTVMTRLGNHYLKSGNEDKAREMGEGSLVLAKELGYPTEIRDAALLLKNIYSGNQQWSKTVEMSELYFSMRDSVQNKENRKELYKQQMRYEYEKKEASLKAQQDIATALSAVELKAQKTQKYFYMGGFSIILLFSILLFNRFRITRNQKEIIENTLEKLQSTQQQLIESEKMAAFGVMASRMAHEIQNPLNFVNNFSEISTELLLESDERTTPEEQATIRKTLDDCLHKISFHGKRAEAIVRKLQEHINAGTAHEFFSDK